MIYDVNILETTEQFRVLGFVCATTDYEGETWERSLYFSLEDSGLETGVWAYCAGEHRSFAVCPTPPEWVQNLFNTVYPRIQEMAEKGQPTEIARFV